MKILSIHIFFDKDENPYRVNSDLEVPGIGNISILEACSKETCVELGVQAKKALLVKLGQRI